MSERALVQTDIGWFLLQNKIHEARLREAFALFRADGIEPILIKGWAISRLYPRTHFRAYSDIDLAVSSAAWENARKLLKSDIGIKLNVDLHRELRHLDSAPWEDLSARSRIVPVEGTDIRVLGEEDHLRVLCVHWLTDSGADRERLWDIFYAVQNRSSEFDWDVCLNLVGSTRRRWIVCTIGLAHKYLGLEIDSLPFAAEAKALPRWLTASIEREWKLGVPLHALYDSLHDRKAFFTQLRKRIPPNAVYSTVECEGEFDDGSRLPYQIKSLVRRALPAIRKIAATINVNRKQP